MRYALYLDIERCSGCQACVVACMDQHDLYISQKEEAWRWVYQIEEGEFPETKISYLSLACLHCQDASCISACPVKAISKDPETSVIIVRPELCIRCRKCLKACPFGVPRFGKDKKMQKCQLCKERLEFGLEPACVRVCPTQALKFGDMGEICKEEERNKVYEIIISKAILFHDRLTK